MVVNEPYNPAGTLMTKEVQVSLHRGDERCPHRKPARLHARENV